MSSKAGIDGEGNVAASHNGDSVPRSRDRRAAMPIATTPEQGRPRLDLPLQSRRGALDGLLALLPEFARPSTVQSGNLVSVSCQEPTSEAGILQAALG